MSRTRRIVGAVVGLAAFVALALLNHVAFRGRALRDLEVLGPVRALTSRNASSESPPTSKPV